MITLSRILVPTDFSSLATRALEYANLIARTTGAEITVLHVDTFIPPLDYPEAPATVYLETIPEVRAAAEDRLREYIPKHVDPKVRTRGRVETDSPIEAIVSAARREPFDLVVMGTHGRSGWRRALLGSVAEAVLRRVNGAVITVREAGTGEPPAVRRILCPVDFTATARMALQYASSLSRLFGADLIAVNVKEDAPENHEVAVQELAAWLPEDLSARCECAELRLGKHPADEILKFADGSGVDLIVLGAQHRTFFDRTVIGTTTEQVTRNARCPVLTVTTALSPQEADREAEELARATGLA
jgi:nucleotide-binding universal stress UspA family protein